MADEVAKKFPEGEVERARERIAELLLITEEGGEDGVEEAVRIAKSVGEAEELVRESFRGAAKRAKERAAAEEISARIDAAFILPVTQPIGAQRPQKVGEFGAKLDAAKAKGAGTGLRIPRVWTPREVEAAEPDVAGRLDPAIAKQREPELKPHGVEEPEPEAEAEPELEPEAEPTAEPQAEVEDDTNAANNIRRKLWRMGEALKHLKAKGVDPPVNKVGSAVCWLSGPDKAAGRACFVECFGEAEGGKAWAAGFPEMPGSVDDIYTVAQRTGWRYPIAVNLNRLDRMVEQTEAALMRVPAEIYQAGNELVRPVRVEVQATKGRKTVVAVLVKIDQAFLKTELTKLVDFFNWKGDVRKGAAVPNDVVNGLLGNYGRWRFPVVSGIVTTPTMRRDGSVLMKEGWDSATGLIVMGPLPAMPPLLEKPTMDDARRAVRILDEELLGEFPFDDGASQSAALSGMITPVVRGMMSAAPLHASSAPAAGTGKSFIWDVSAGIAVGDAMPIISVGGGLEELEKRLNTEILKGLTIFSIRQR
jgi:hypothetical protein